MILDTSVLVVRIKILTLGFWEGGGEVLYEQKTIKLRN